MKAVTFEVNWSPTCLATRHQSQIGFQRHSSPAHNVIKKKNIISHKLIFESVTKILSLCYKDIGLLRILTLPLVKILTLTLNGHPHVIKVRFSLLIVS